MTMEVELYFVRHGETQGNRTHLIQGQVEIPMNDLGIKQANNAGDALKDVKFDGAYSSPYSRAHDTANIILDQNNKAQCDANNEVQTKVEKWELLSERGFGIVDGKHYTEYFALTEANNGEKWIFTPEGGESIPDVKNRAGRCFEELCNDFWSKWGGQVEYGNPKKTVLVASHGLFTLCMMSHLVKENSMKFTTEDKEYRKIAANTSFSKILIKLSPPKGSSSMPDLVSLTCTDLYNSKHLATLPDSFPCKDLVEKDHY